MTVGMFRIEEIRKWSWATTFEKEVGKLPGVRGARVDMGSRTMEVDFDGAAVARAAIEGRIAETLERFRSGGRSVH
jgi:hypothetical protein